MKKTTILLLTIITVYSCNSRAKTPAAAAAAPTAVDNDSARLNGSWQLTNMDGLQEAFATLYPAKVPMIRFDLSQKQVSGNTGCNSFSGEPGIEGSTLRFDKPMAMTKMFCPGEGENIFLQHLQRVKKYLLKNDTLLHLLSGDTLVMELKRSKIG